MSVPPAEGASKRGRGLETLTLVFAALFPSAGAWLYFFLLTSGWPFHVAYAGSKVIQFGLPVLWLLAAGARGMKREGRAPLRPGALVARGAAWGAVMGAVIIAVYAFLIRGGPAAAEASARVIGKLEGVGAASLPRYVALALFISLIHSGLEEYYWRWFLFGRLRERMPFGPAAVLGSIAFAAHHVLVLAAYLGSGPGAVWILPLTSSVVVAGLIWAWLYERTGSLVPGWTCHVVTDLAIMAVGWHLMTASP